MKEKIRNFLDNHSISGVIILYIVSWIFIQICGILIDSLISKYVFPQYPGSIVSIIFSFVALWAFKKLYSPEYKGSLCARGTLKGVLFAWPVLLPLAVSVFAFKFTDTIVVSFITAFWAGINEEVVSRGLPISFATYHYKESKNIPWIVFITGMVFGLTHYQNMLVGGTFFGTTIQVINAATMGMLYGAIFIRTGTLWSGVIVHTLNDFILFMASGSVMDAGVNNYGFDVQKLVIIVPAIIYVLVAFYIIRPKKHEEIMTLWNTKWSR